MYTQLIGNDSNKISRYGAIKHVLLCIYEVATPVTIKKRKPLTIRSAFEC